MYNEKTNAHLIESLGYHSVFIAPTCFNANTSSSGSSYSVYAGPSSKNINNKIHRAIVLPGVLHGI
jgi:hypothetical protein